MFVTELFEGNQQQIKVIYPGRFQPFHKGHAAVYNHLVRQYGADNVFIVTSDKTDNDKSPFSFEEKKRMMVLTGIDASKVVQSTQPYRAMEIVSKLDPSTVLMFAISEKDMAEDPRFQFAPKKDGSPSYFQPFSDITQCKSLEHHAYMITVPTFEFKVLGASANSASQIRAQFANADEATQQKIVADLFGKFDHGVYTTMRSKLAKINPVTESVLQKKRFNWSDYSYFPGETILKLAEAWVKNGNVLLEDNDPAAESYFIGLPFDSPSAGSKYLACVLALVNGDVIIMHPLDTITYIAAAGKYHKVRLSNGKKTEFPAESIRNDMTTKTFFFKSIQSYDKFRSGIALKFNTELPTMSNNISEASAHKKEVERKRKEYERAQAEKREKAGETFHYGNAKVTKPPVTENTMDDTQNPDPKIQHLAKAVIKMKQQLAQITAGNTLGENRKMNSKQLGGVPWGKQMNEAYGPPMSQKFPDSKAGVIAFMSDPKEVNKNFTSKLNLPKCKIFPDPSAQGVWGIDSIATGIRVIVYLAGYKDSMGEIRRFNDFEEGEIPRKALARYKRNSQERDDHEDYMNENTGAKEYYDSWQEWKRDVQRGGGDTQHCWPRYDSRI